MRGSSWASAGRTPTTARTSPSSASWTRRRVMPRSAAGLFWVRRLVDLLRLGGLLQLFGLRVVRLGGELGMTVLKTADGLTEVLVRHQALRLHVLEDLAPARVLLLRGNLRSEERRGPSARCLRLEHGACAILFSWCL